MKTTNTSNSSGIGFIGLLTILFITLKLTNVISWTWVWVLSPLWISTVVSIIIIGLVIFWVEEQMKTSDINKMSDKNKTEACYNCGTIIYTEFNDFKVIEGTIYCKECALKRRQHMKISPINTVPISAIETFCKNHNLAMQCNDGKVGEAINDGKVGEAIKEASNEL